MAELGARPSPPSRGYTYLLLLIGIAIIGMASAASVQTGIALQRHANEEALLELGAEVQRALMHYQQLGGAAPPVPGRPAGLSPANCPAELQDLLKDPRSAAPRRFLRRIPVDPLTTQTTWGVVRNSAGKIAGIYSLAEGRPLKQTGFGLGQDGFENAGAYADWLFGRCGLV